jgi:fructosamine-3-kinase
MQPAQIRFVHDPLRVPLERLVSRHAGRPWALKTARDLADLACHPAALLSDGSYAVFAKLSEAPNGFDQFEIELAGLCLLAERAGVLIPTPIGILPIPGGSILVLEAVEAVERTERHWRQIGQALARIHQVKGERFGLERNGFFGPLDQDNAPLDDWPTFFGERRLEPGLKLAADSGNLPHEFIRPIETIIARLPELCGPAVIPALLHGDAQQNNFISTAKGTVIIDPAVYFGHPEVDLAYLDYFQPVPEAVFDGYREELPIDPGFEERRGLWRIWGYLGAVTVEGAGYLSQLESAFRRYV